MIRAAPDTPTGPVTIEQDGGAIVRLRWGRGGEASSALLDRAKAQLADCFAGRLEVFDLPMAPGGEGFHRAFLRVLGAIPFGRTRTYGEIARQVGVSAGGGAGLRRQSDPDLQSLPPGYWGPRALAGFPAG